MKKNKENKEKSKQKVYSNDDVSSQVCIDARERYDYLNYLSDEIAENSKNELPNER